MESESCKYCSMSGAHSPDCPTQFKAKEDDAVEKEKYGLPRKEQEGAAEQLGGDRFETLKLEKAKLLLLSPEEENAMAREKSPDKYVVRTSGYGGEVVAYGTAHRFDRDAIDDMVKVFEAENPDLVLVEGEGVELVEQLVSELDENEIISKYGEQVFMAWLAKKNGKLVKSWDVSSGEQLEKVVKKHGPDAVLGWLLGQGLKHIYERKQKLSAEALSQLIKIAYGEQTFKRMEAEFGLDFSEENLERLAQKYAGKKMVEITVDDAEKLATPRMRGETNDVLRDMNSERDKHAIEVIAEVRKKNKKIFITAGGSHVITWEKAIKELYKN